MTIKDVSTQQVISQQTKLANLEIRPSSDDQVFLIISGNGDASVLIPEAEWRRLCRESCGEQVTLRGFTTDDGLHVVQYRDGLIAIGENRPNGPSIKMTPDQWVRLWQCGAAGWQDGPPTEKYVPYAIEYRAHIIPHKKIELRVFAGTLQRIIEDADPVLYAFVEDFPIPNGPGEATIPKADIVRHFRVPDPPKSEPVPEPPKWVRVKASIASRGSPVVGQQAWACRDGGGWIVLPDGGTHIQAGYKEADWIEVTQ